MYRVALFLASALPAVLLFYHTVTEQLGPNPLETIQRDTGLWALIFLIIVLAVTPLREITRKKFGNLFNFVKYRRQLGLWMAFYSTAHVLVWIGLDLGFNWPEIIATLTEKTYLYVGLAAFLLTVPLALTSNSWSVRRLGTRWRQLHRVVYAVAVLALVHYFLHKAGKNDFAEFSIYAGLTMTLLAWRVRSLFSTRRA